MRSGTLPFSSRGSGEAARIARSTAASNAGTPLGFVVVTLTTSPVGNCSMRILTTGLPGDVAG